MDRRANGRAGKGACHVLSGNKFGARKTTVFRQTFDSKKEAERYLMLRAMQKAGEISDLETQVTFELVPAQKDANGKTVERAVSYVADFVYRKDGKRVVEDTKGYKGGAAYNVFKIKRKLMRWIHGIEVIEV